MSDAAIESSFQFPDIPVGIEPEMHEFLVQLRVLLDRMLAGNVHIAGDLKVGGHIKSAGNITASKVQIDDSNTEITDDGSSNLTLKNVVTGTKTLAQIIDNSLSSGCRVHRSGSDQTTGGAGSYNKVQFTTEDFDINNEFDNSVNYRFTPTEAGYYLVNLNITFSDLSAGDYAEAYIYKNGVGYALDTTVVDAAWFTASVSALVYCNGTTDYIEGYARTTGAAKTIWGGSVGTFISIAKL